MSVNTATSSAPRGAALRANKEAATAHAAAAKIRGLNAPFEQGVFDPPHPPRLMGKCNCRRGENGLDAGHHEAEKAYKRHTAGPEVGRWGLPKKERYYRGDIAKVLGMTEGQVRYAVAKGRIQQGAGVDAWGRPFWTEEEVERLLPSRNQEALKRRK